jgi:hypothetical protein
MVCSTLLWLLHTGIQDWIGGEVTSLSLTIHYYWSHTYRGTPQLL